MVVDRWTFRKCVSFLAEGHEGEPMGSAFIVCAEAPWWAVYLVTARHNLEYCDKDKPLVARFNTAESGLLNLAVPVDNWVQHSVTDVAIVRIDLPGSVQYAMSYIPMNKILRSGDKGLFEGMPTFIPSLFGQYYGRAAMHPIVRSGQLALIPDEKVIANLGPISGDREIDAFLIECMVWGGCSGAPVFVHANKDEAYLLGLINGHYPQKTKVKRTGKSHSAGTECGSQQQHDYVDQNAGIAVVIPGEAVLELLYLEHVVKERNENCGPPQRLC